MTKFNLQPMLNIYPDSLAGNLRGTIDFLDSPQVRGVFHAVYILPSLYHTDLDRGFSVIDYSLNKELVKKEDLAQLDEWGIKTKLDFILNHASVLSPQFQSVIQYGTQSEYYDFFIDWNKFWKGKGELTKKGYIQPYNRYIDKMFFRKPELPILTITTATNELLTFWNTFYQEKKYPKVTVQMWMKVLGCQYSHSVIIEKLVREYLDSHDSLEYLDLAHLNNFLPTVTQYLEANCEYLGQMDLNIKSPLVWSFYEQTMKQLKNYGASIVRLDAFAYGPKEIGERNFLNDPDTWKLLEKLNSLASKYELTLLPEIHESYEENIYERISNEGYLTYDFFLPGLVLYTIESKDAGYLVKWFNEILYKNIKTVNMLGCHDGIPLLDLKGLLPEKHIRELIEKVVDRGGYVKNLHGQNNMYYQVNATFYSALGENNAKMMLARAIQLYMPGKPQIWYLDIFTGRNDYEAVERAGIGGHKEINRTNLSNEDIVSGLNKQVVQDQLRLIKFRNEFMAFDIDAKISVISEGSQFKINWQYKDHEATMSVDLEKPSTLIVTGKNAQGQKEFSYEAE